MNRKTQNPKRETGTCKFCYVPQVAPGAKRCPVCRMRTPCIALEEVAGKLVRRGRQLHAMSLLTTIRGCDIVEAQEYCDPSRPQEITDSEHSTEERVAKLVETEEYGLAVEFVRQHSTWGSKEAKEYVNLVRPGAFQRERQVAAATSAS